MIDVDPASPVPPYEQVRAALAGQIADGRLPAGTRLPSVRQLAADLALAANTVARAYRELEAAGVVETRGRGGTVVLAGDAAHRRVVEAARIYAAVARANGVGTDEAVSLLRAAFA